MKSLVQPGKKYLIRTVEGYAYLGEVVSCNPMSAIMKDVSWVADSGRLGTAIAEGQLEKASDSEIEYFGKARIEIDLMHSTKIEWLHKLPKKTK